MIICVNSFSYTEGYNDKFAYPLSNSFDNADDIIQFLMEFLSYIVFSKK